MAGLFVGAGRGGAGMCARWGSGMGAVLKMGGGAGYAVAIGIAKVGSGFFVVAAEGMGLWC